MQQDVGVLEDGLHGFGVGDEVGRDVALVELDTLGDLELGAQGGGLLDGDHAIDANRGHRLADHGADDLVPRGHGGDLGDGVLAVDGGGRGREGLAHGVRGGGDAHAHGHRVGSGGDVAQPRADHGLGQDGGGGGAVACDVVRLGGDALGELGAEVLEGVVELDLPGDGDAVVGDDGAAEALGEHDVAPARSEGDLDRVGQLVDPALHGTAGGLVELDLLGHVWWLSWVVEERALWHRWRCMTHTTPGSG